MQNTIHRVVYVACVCLSRSHYGVRGEKSSVFLVSILFHIEWWNDRRSCIVVFTIKKQEGTPASILGYNI